MTEADILSLRVQATRVQQLRSDLRSIKGDLVGIHQATLSHASASRSAARAVASGYDQMALAAKRSASAQSSAMASVKKSVFSAAAAYGAVRIAQNAIRAQESQAGFAAAFKYNLGAQQGARSNAELSGFAQKQGLKVGGVQQAGIGLASAGVRPEDLVATIRGLSAAGAAGGATSEGMKGAMEQYKQIAMNGKLQGDELRLIQENGVNLIAILKNAGLGDRIRDKQNPLTFEEVNAAIIAFGKTKEASELLTTQASRTTSAFNRVDNILEQRLYPALANGFGPAAEKVATILAGLAENIDPKMVENLVVPVAVGLAGAFAITKAANTALAWSAWRAAGALNAVAMSGGGGAIGGVGKVGGLRGLAKNVWGYAGNAGTGASGVGMVGGRGIAGGLSAAGNALGFTGGAASAPLAASAGAIAGATISAAAVAVGAYFATKYGLDALARAAGHDGYSDALRKDFARANGARIDAAGNESYRGTGEAAFLASRARSAAKRGAAPSGDIYAKYAGLESRNFDAAMSRRNSQRPANRASTQNRVARETRDAIRSAT